MYTRLFVVFLSLILSFPCLSQDPSAYFDECISHPEDYYFTTPPELEVNSEGEIYHVVGYPALLVKRDRNGAQLWKKELPGTVQKFWMDEFDNVCLIVGQTQTKTGTFTNTRAMET